MTRLRRFAFARAALLAAVCFAVPAYAQPRASLEDQKKAQEHFQKARELYSSGRYGDANAELEIARGLDPKAKDLVMNLGIVNEKLGKYDDAIHWFKTFLDMDDISPAEKSRAEGFIKRIEGAKKEQAAKRTTPPASSSAPTTAPTSAPTTAPPPVEPENGRVDGATIATGAVAAVGLVAGATFGLFALTSRPNDFTTGRDGTYDDLQSKTDSAHTMAIVADIALGVGVVATVATLYLYFGRSKEPSRTATFRGFTF